MARAVLAAASGGGASPGATDAAPGPAPGGGPWGVALSPGLHEWFLDDDRPSRAARGRWLAPMSVLIGLAWRAAEEGDPGRAVVWVGRRGWPYPPALVRRAGPSGVDRRLLERSVFVDPSSRGERVWAIELAARGAGVAAVVADGSGLTMAESRRLQLAASGDERRAGTPALLARPARERRELSAARTRWRVTPSLGAPPDGRDVYRQGWTIELLRRKGVRPAGARRWAVWRDHETGETTSAVAGGAPGDVDLAGALGDGPDPPARARIA